MNAQYKIFTDGACTKNGREGAIASYGWAIYQNNELIKEGKGKVQGKQTNNRGELSGILYALQYFTKAYPHTPAELYTDSECSLKGINKIAKTEQGLTNLDLLREIKPIMYGITFKHIRGHMKDDSFETQSNNYVDRLATSVIEDIQSEDISELLKCLDPMSTAELLT